MNYHNEGIDMYADDYDPTLILQCGFCARHIAYYGDADDDDKARGTFTLGASEQAVCECGAFYGEDDVLDVVREDDAPTASDSAAELAALRDENARLRQAMERALTVGIEPSLGLIRLHSILKSALKGGE